MRQDLKALLYLTISFDVVSRIGHLKKANLSGPCPDDAPAPEVICLSSHLLNRSVTAFCIRELGRVQRVRRELVPETGPLLGKWLSLVCAFLARDNERVCR
jgi:hypothetical protein